MTDLTPAPEADEDAPQPTASDAVAAVTSLEAEEAAGTDEVKPDMLKVRDREFPIRAKMPAMSLLRLSAASGPNASVPEQMASIYNFLTKVIDKEHSDEFLAYLENTEPEIEFEELSKVMEEAMAVVGGRPT